VTFSRPWYDVFPCRTDPTDQFVIVRFDVIVEGFTIPFQCMKAKKKTNWIVKCPAKLDSKIKDIVLNEGLSFVRGSIKHS
jgi:hypothetical protein